MVFITDKISQEAQAVLDEGDAERCPFSWGKQLKVKDAVQPLVDSFSAGVDPLDRPLVHAVAGGCDNSCQAQVGHGYLELVQQLEGRRDDICQVGQGNSLVPIADRVVGAVAPHRFVGGGPGRSRGAPKPRPGLRLPRALQDADV